MDTATTNGRRGKFFKSSNANSKQIQFTGILFQLFFAWSWVKKLLIGKLDCEQKKQIIKSTVWNVALYAVESWTLPTPNKIIARSILNVDVAEDAENQSDKESDKRRGVGMCQGN